jgi:hypothetical protein
MLEYKSVYRVAMLNRDATSISPSTPFKKRNPIIEYPLGEWVDVPGEGCTVSCPDMDTFFSAHFELVVFECMKLLEEHEGYCRYRKVKRVSPIPITKDFIENNPQIRYPKGCADWAIFKKRYELITYFHEHGDCPTYCGMTYAAQRGHFKTIKLLFNLGVEFVPDCVYFACEENNLKLVRWMLARKFPYDKELADIVATWEQPELLQLLAAFGISPTKQKIKRINSILTTIKSVLVGWITKIRRELCKK